MSDTPMPYFRHRCDQWKDVRIHPDLAMVWDTCLAHYADLKPPTWMLLDEGSATCSIYTAQKCPYCATDLSALLALP